MDSLATFPVMLDLSLYKQGAAPMARRKSTEQDNQMSLNKISLGGRAQVVWRGC
jgi:hypothetical protein